MSPMQYRHRREYEQVLKYTEQLHSLMESGEFWDLSFFERRKLVRRVNKLYRRLAGIFALGPTKTALLAAGVLALTACPSNGSGDDTGGDDPTTGNVTISFDGTAIDDLVADALDSLTFSAEIVDFNGDPSYQWFYDGDALEGETNATLSFSPPKTINTTGLEDFYSPRDGAPNLHELKVEVTDSETSETFTATVDLTVRIDPEFSADWKAMPVGLYAEMGGYFPNVLFGDLDGDGDIDGLFVSYNGYGYAGYYSYDNYFSWFERSDDSAIEFTSRGSTGLYAFDSVRNYGVEYTDVWRRPTELADLDGDGDADIIVGTFSLLNDEYNNYAAVSFGFDIFQNNSTGQGNASFSVGDPPLTVPGIDPEVAYFTYDTDWPYGFDPDNYSGNAKFWIPSLELVDMDGDGDFDLLTSQLDYSGTIKRTVLLRTNTGTNEAPAFGSPVELISDDNLVYYPLLTAADIDRDGDIDIFLSETINVSDGITNAVYSGVKFFVNEGDSTTPNFSEFTEAPPLGFDFYEQAYGASPPKTPFQITVADLDGDGDLDVVTGWYSAPYGYAPIAFFNDATGSTTRPDWINEGFTVPLD